MTPPVQATSANESGIVARLGAEALGTMFLVLIAVGVKIFSNQQGGPLPASLATGLALTAGMLAFGYVSGGHFNPAITLGNLIVGRIRAVAALAYVAAQVVGGVVGAALVYLVVRTVPVLTDARAAFDTAAPGYGEHAVAQTQLAGVLLVEVIGSAVLVAVFLGATAGRRAAPAMAPFAVGLALAVLLQFGQVLGNIPFNPAHATGLAFFSSSWALGSLWLFWVSPLMGAALAGFAFRGFSAVASVDVNRSSRVTAAKESRKEPDEDLHLEADDTVDDDFDAPINESGKESTRDSEAAGKNPVVDDARDFFDGRKG
ncbi:aquaporin [Paenarthrobacter sp. NPDC089322]|uniref:MIP/aquaporin family protein n=1 Tax=Paenarthrobacter sp. NPDC089322 TaxID=3155065 RepID=UPI0034403F4E